MEGHSRRDLPEQVPFQLNEMKFGNLGVSQLG